ncbi:MAG: DRTGG domain-containing protein [Kyrpidia sp.]|nr:DRTGG domain-containing protein [Kyrpidia sp.]
MATKHELILQHIEDLAVGSKISVRQIAKMMDVSEGTAYRAIKEAEMRGIVSTIERVGTVRIEKQQKKNIERLTFAEVVNVVDGTVLAGRAGLHKTLTKFVIGAMEIDAMLRYIDKDCLLIVGNREEAHRASLEHGAAVLITGGFDTNDEVKALADRRELPLISSAYDTFTIATLINRAIYDRLIKKEIVLVEDLIGESQPVSIVQTSRVGDYRALVSLTGHTRFPVVDAQFRVVGMITSKDVTGEPDDLPIERLMSKNPITVTPKTSVASAAHIMVWEGIELLPVVENRRLVGVISRQDVIKALQYMQKQPQVGQTIEDIVLSHFKEEKGPERTVWLTGEITPQMSNRLGGVSTGVIMTLIAEAGSSAIRRTRHSDMVVENVSIYFLKPIQIDSTLSVKAAAIDMGRKFGKADVELYHNGELVGKALFTAQVLER